MSRPDHHHSQSAFSIIELVVVLSIVGILAFTAVANFRELENALANAAFTTENFLRLARADAIAHTEAITIAPASSTRLAATHGDTCAGTMTTLPELSLTLPRGAHFSETTWTVCFNSRGLVDEAISFDLVDASGNSKTVRIALGGGTSVD